MAKIELATYVEAPRDEVQRCIQLSEGKDLRYGTDKLDLEIDVAVETEVGGKGEVKRSFTVCDATLGADGKGTITNAQKVKMRLAPVYKGQAGPMIAGTSSNQRL